MTTRFSALRTYMPSRKSEEDSDDPFTLREKLLPNYVRCRDRLRLYLFRTLVLQVDYQGNIISASSKLDNPARGHYPRKNGTILIKNSMVTRRNQNLQGECNESYTHMFCYT